MNLINGECLEELKKIEDKSVDCFICDLPYGTTGCKWDNKIDLDELWIEMKRTARNDKTPFFFFCDMKLAVNLINSNPKWFRYDLVWYKTNSKCGHLNSGKMPMRSHELLLVFYKKLPTYNKKEYHKRVCYNDGKKKYPDESQIYGKSWLNDNFKFGTMYDVVLPISVLKYPIENKMTSKMRYHPTQKPQGILEWIIKYYSNKGDTILDPTMGSASTGVACKTLNRNFIGIEMNKEYFDVAIERINNLNE
jgi:site-specific DNA-methyltransferase (adenine-specific)